MEMQMLEPGEKTDSARRKQLYRKRHHRFGAEGKTGGGGVAGGPGVKYQRISGEETAGSWEGGTPARASFARRFLV